MATNDFLPFANGGGANVLTQAQYAALTTLLSGGYQSGVANSAQMNKTWRQSSIMAAVLGQFAADYSGNNSVDDGTTTTLEANLVAAIRSATKTGVILADTGAVNAYTAVNVPPLVSGTWTDGVIQQVKIAHANTGASTYAPDGLTAIPIYGLGLQPLQGGELALNGTAVLMHATLAGVNSGNPIAVLMECAGGAQQIAPATQSQHAAQFSQVNPGRLLRVTRYRNSGGTLQSSVNGGAYATASSTFTAQALTTAVYVELLGGGGSGGSAQATTTGQYAAGSGGGGGGGCKKWISSGFNGVTVTVGAGGATTSPGSAGNTGGSSSFGSICSATGGAGGSLGTAATGGQGLVGQAGGGQGANGDSNLQGSPGGAASYNASSITSGLGGASCFGGGGAPFSTGTAAGVAATSPGAGGSGGSSGPSNGTGAAGGAAVGGEITVWEYA